MEKDDLKVSSFDKEMYSMLCVTVEAHMLDPMRRCMMAMNAVAPDGAFTVMIGGILNGIVGVKALMIFDASMKKQGVPRDARHEVIRENLEAIFNDVVRESDKKYDEQGRRKRPDGSTYDDT